ncbi:serine hydrolase domain-containing protein [Cellvibrio mixtus]|uniref:serine hydrolase domain-containing protein n=1 Tax=Cellvibrio mixtus TaxID=39650 RepID=UPI000586C766|nr:serine hydrolase [Cellvibrio mixtus]
MERSAIRKNFVVMCTAVFTLSSVVAFAAEEKIPDALESDPIKLGWMIGFPPPEDRIIRFDDGSYFKFPQMRWSVSNFRQLMPTVNVSRGVSVPSELKQKIDGNINQLMFLPTNSKQPMTWEASLLANFTDGIIVLHKGNIVYERYFGVLGAEGQHAAMSVTKTFIGTLAAMMVADGLLDANKKIAEYIPELAKSAFGNASLRQVMDMTTGIRFREDYADPTAEVWAHAAAGNPLTKPKDYKGPRSYYDFLQTVQAEGSHGDGFHYRTANTDVLGWVLARVSGRSVAQLLSERIWKKLGAEQDAYMSVDSTGTPFAGGGLNTGLRDLARFGEMIRNNGMYNGQKIISQTVIDDIRQGANKKDFAKAGYKHLTGWSYRNMWWVTHNKNGAFMARGVHGQALYIDPAAGMVIARFASHPIASNSANDPTSLPAYYALGEYLLGLDKLKK